MNCKNISPQRIDMISISIHGHTADFSSNENYCFPFEIMNQILYNKKDMRCKYFLHTWLVLRPLNKCASKYQGSYVRIYWIPDLDVQSSKIPNSFGISSGIMWFSQIEF